MGRRPRERVRRGPSLFDVLLNQLVVQRASAILQHAYTHSNTHGLFLFRKGGGCCEWHSVPIIRGIPPPSSLSSSFAHPTSSYSPASPQINLSSLPSPHYPRPPCCPPTDPTPSTPRPPHNTHRPPFSFALSVALPRYPPCSQMLSVFPAPLRRVASFARCYVVLSTNILIWHTVVGLSIAVASAFLFPHEL